MGKQNFLQGGFKGKVGAFVGKGWKDMLIIQSAPSVNNPRTPAQNKNRAGFARRVEACKLAMQANYNASFWEDTHTTKWALMMSSSAKAFNEDKNILEYTPLIPYGYSPAYVTSDDPTTSGQNVVLSFDTTDDISGRAMSVLLYVKESSSEKYAANLVVASVAGSSGSWTVTARIPDGYEIDEKSYVSAVSRDDANFSDVCLYQPPFAIGSTSPTTVFTLSSPEIDFAEGNESVYFWLTPSETLPVNTQVRAGAGSLRGVLQGAWVTDTLQSEMIESDGRITFVAENCLDPLGQRPMFVSGSSLTIQPFSFKAGGVKYKFEGATFNLSETPTAQKLYFPTTTYNFATDHANGLIIARDVQLSGSSSIGLTAKAVDSNLSVSDTLVYFNLMLSNGNLIMKDTASGRYFFGSQQTATMSYQRGVTMRGVKYTIDQSQTWTLVPTATQVDLAFTEEGRTGLIWIDNRTNGDIYAAYETSAQNSFIISSITPVTATLVANDYPQNWQTTQQSCSVEPYTGVAELSFTFHGSYNETDGRDGTFTFTAPEQTLVEKTIENSDGFKIKVTFGGDSFTETAPST